MPSIRATLLTPRPTPQEAPAAAKRASTTHKMASTSRSSQTTGHCQGTKRRRTRCQHLPSLRAQNPPHLRSRRLPTNCTMGHPAPRHGRPPNAPRGANAREQKRRGTNASMLTTPGSAWHCEVDFKKAFLSFEWGCIRETMYESLPDMVEWLQKCQAKPGTVPLPLETKLHIDLGAKQNNPLGPSTMSLCLRKSARAQKRHCKTKMCTSSTRGTWTADKSYACPAMSKLCCKYLISTPHVWVHHVGLARTRGCSCPSCKLLQPCADLQMRG